MHSRCFKSFISFVSPPQVEAFVSGMTEGGVVLEEPETYKHDTKPDDYFPEYLGQEHEDEIQHVRKEWLEKRDREFNNYNEKLDQKAR